MASLTQPSPANREGWGDGATETGLSHRPRTDMIRIEKLGKTFTTADDDVTALESIDIAIKEGEFVSIVGPSGCGKSTLLMCVAGLIEASAGSVTIGNRRVSGPFTDLRNRLPGIAAARLAHRPRQPHVPDRDARSRPKGL